MKNKNRFSSWIWGTFMLLIATFVLSNQLGGFVEIGLGSIIAAALAITFMIQCIMRLSFAPMPIPIAILYIIFQKPYEWPYIQYWSLFTAALFAVIGLSILLPRKHRQKNDVFMGYNGKKHYSRGDKHYSQMTPEDGGSDNNPSVSVSFGGISRYLHSDCLESAHLSCSFGALEIFFDQVQLSQNGATVNIDCSFGAVKIFIPKHWRVIDRLNCSLGGVDIDDRFSAVIDNSPVLTLIGEVSLGAVEVNFI